MRRKGSFRPVLMVVSIFLLSNIFNFISTEARSSTDDVYDPFFLIGDNETLIAHHHIQGDEELIQFVDAYGTGGSGTSVDPYIVSGLYVPVRAGEKCGLIIENTTLHISFYSLKIEMANYSCMVISNSTNISLISMNIHNLRIDMSRNITLIDITFNFRCYILYSHNIDIRDNKIRLNFEFFHSEGIIIENNSCTYGDSGFYFSYCSDLDFVKNTFSSTRDYIIEFHYYSWNIVVRNNTFLGGKWGLYLCGGSNGRRIYGNLFTSFSSSAIYLAGGWSIINDNLFRENRGGVFSTDASYCSITRNIFLNNYYYSILINNVNDHYRHDINNNSFYIFNRYVFLFYTLW